MELHLLARGQDAGTGLEYGATAGDLGLFDNDGTAPGYDGGDRGWQAVARLGVAF